MAVNFQMPPTGFGPGSQPEAEDGQELDYLPMPSGMRTYEPHVPMLDESEAQQVARALEILADVADACDEAASTGVGASFDLSRLDAKNRAIIADTFGEGEVACVISGSPELRAQESVFAGVWSVRGEGVDRIEVGPVPREAMRRAHDAQTPAGGLDAALAEGVVNAPALISELLDASRVRRAGAEPHVINLSLLPHTPEDLEHLDIALGTGSAMMLSRGYGNCRVTATATPSVWRVQFFNSMDVLILDTIEVVEIPEVACAAQEDFQDSAERLRDVREAIQS